MNTKQHSLNWIALVGIVVGLGAAAPCWGQERVKDGLLVFYDFTTTEGTKVADRSNVGEPLHLRIENVGAVRRSPGKLEVRTPTRIRSERPADKIIAGVKKSNAITLEAWVQAAKIDQSGPARMLSLSKNTNERNFTLGHDEAAVEVRLRTSKTSKNGIPALPSPKKSFSTGLTHIVYTRDSRGQARLYINNKQTANKSVAGDMNNWDGSFTLNLANEASSDRPWLGSYHLIAVYDRSLSAEEVAQNFAAGAQATAPPPLTMAQQTKRFNDQVAPLLAKRCVECHRPGVKKGSFDITRRASAFAGGDNGQAITPGDAGASLLWDYIESDEMPQDRPPLSDAEKKLLRAWINDGAVWSLDSILSLANLPPPKPGANWLRRLTVNEYIETVRYGLNVDIAADARRILPRDLRADGFTNTAYNLNVDLDHIEAFAQLAQIIVKQMDVRKFAEFFNGRKPLDKNRLSTVVKNMGRWVLRSPLTEEETATYLAIASAVEKEGGSPLESVEFILEGMLQSPRFIYRIEKQGGGPRAVEGYELASRLSYILWGGPPDAELYRAAAEGDLSNPSAVVKQVDRMLASPRAAQRSEHFLAQWLNLDRLDHLRPSSKHFPDWRPELAADMKAETLAFFREVAWKQRRPLSELLNAQVTFATPELAAHYGLTPQAKDTPRYDLQAIPARGGLLTQGSVLTMGGDEASMVTRGLFVLHDLLEGSVEDPPACVDTTPKPSRPGLSQRAIAEGRIANQACGGCHKRFEPLAFGLEKFDGLGAYLEIDRHGNKLREDGRVVFPGNPTPTPYQTSAALMDILAASDQVQRTLTNKVAQFAIGRPLTETDQPLVAAAHQQSQKNGGTYAAVIKAIVLSDLVRETK